MLHIGKHVCTGGSTSQCCFHAGLKLGKQEIQASSIFQSQENPLLANEQVTEQTNKQTNKQPSK